ncbi:MAG: acyl-CoA thioesterase [Myxococcota bacterium]
MNRASLEPAPSLASTRFERDTAVRRIGPGVYEVSIDRGWWISRGPNGGYVAALVLRALTAQVGDPERAVRSLSVHFPSAPAEGCARIETRTERSGRSLTTVSATLVQEGRTCALALAAFSRPRAAPELQAAELPRVSPPEACPAPEPAAIPIPLRERYESRVALAPALPGEAPIARAGGWIRLCEPQPADACVIAALCDAWPPTLMGHAWPEGYRAPLGFPTVDLTVHFRCALPLPHHDPAAYHLVQFSTQLVRDGFVDEEGEIWTPDGQLIAQSRQLGVLL